MDECIDLKTRFPRYRVDYERSYVAQYGSRSHVNDPWLKIVPCRFGHIFPWGGSDLAASTACRGSVANRLNRLACTELVQDGDDGITVIFDVDDFPRVAALMKPRRRWRPTTRQRDVLAHNLKGGQEPPRYAPQNDQKRALVTSPDTLPA